MSYVRAACRNLDVASSVVSVNARGHTLGHPQRSYPVLAENLELGRLPRGLQSVLIAKLSDDECRERILQFCESEGSGELARAVQWLAQSDGAYAMPVAEHPAWSTVLGSDIAWSDYAYKRGKAIARIAELARLFKTLGSAGIVLLFDEVETIDQLWNVRSRRLAYSVLGALSRMDNVWCIFAVTARFDRALEGDLRGALDDPGLSEAARWFLEEWEKKRLELMDPPRVDGEGARLLAERVERLYELAHGFRLADRRGVLRCVEEWSEDAGGNPRTLIRRVVDCLDRRRPIQAGASRSTAAGQ
jgi:hypothetical protein